MYSANGAGCCLVYVAVTPTPGLPQDRGVVPAAARRVLRRSRRAWARPPPWRRRRSASAAVRPPAGRCPCRSPATARGRGRRAPPGRAARSVPATWLSSTASRCPNASSPVPGTLPCTAPTLQRARLGLRVERDGEADQRRRRPRRRTRAAVRTNRTRRAASRTWASSTPATTTRPLSSGAPPQEANAASGESACENASRPHGNPPNGHDAAQLLGRDPQEREHDDLQADAAPHGVAAARPRPCRRRSSAKYSASRVLSAIHGTRPTASSAQVISGANEREAPEQPDEGVPARAVAAQGQEQQRHADEGRAPPAGCGEREAGEQAARDGEDESPPAGGFTGGHRSATAGPLSSRPASDRPARVSFVPVGVQAHGPLSTEHAGPVGALPPPRPPGSASARHRRGRVRGGGSPEEPTEIHGGVKAASAQVRAVPAGHPRTDRSCLYRSVRRVVARVVGSGRSGRSRSHGGRGIHPVGPPVRRPSERVVQDDAVADRAQARRRRGVGRHVGQQRDARRARRCSTTRTAPRPTAPSGARRARRRGAPGDPTRSSPAPVWSRPATRQPPRVEARNAARAEIRWSAAWCCTRQRARRPTGRRAVTGESEPNASGTPAAARSASGLSAAARPAPRRVAYMPVGAAPRGVERRLHAEAHAQQHQRRERRRVDHLGVLEAVAHARDGVGTLDVHGGAQPEQQLVHRAVADDVEAALDAGAGHGGEVVADLLGGQVEHALVARRVGVRRPHRGRVRPQRAVDVEVAADPGQAGDRREDLARVVDRHALLAAVADEVRQPVARVARSARAARPGPRGCRSTARCARARRRPRAPRRAARARRYRAVRRSGETARAASRAAWCASRSTRPSKLQPGSGSRPASRDRALETTAEWTSTRAR